MNNIPRTYQTLLLFNHDSNTSPRETLNEWREHLQISSFIHDYVKEKYIKRLTMASIITILFQGLFSVLGISGYLGLIYDVEILTTICNISIIVLPIITSVLGGIIALFTWKSHILVLSEYNGKINVLLSELNTILSIGDDMVNLKQVLIDKSKAYQNLIREAPNISQSQYIKALKKYSKLFENV